MFVVGRECHVCDTQYSFDFISFVFQMLTATAIQHQFVLKKMVPRKGLLHVRGFPYQENNPKGPLRNKEDTIRHAAEVTKKQLAGEKCSNVMGVKGPSWLSFLTHYGGQSVLLKSTDFGG